MASSSTRSPHTTYDVFLSFRGEDTRKNFTDHLYNTLIAYGIRTFRDDEQLQKGDDIKSGLSTAIQVSNIFLIIFSENYATSKWCLNELVKIIECTEADDDDDQGKRVIPVFYHVQPRDVGHQSGSFQDAFLNHEKDANQEKMELIGKWRIALQKAAKLSGYHVDNQYEAEIIQKIREVIITRLNRKPLHVGDNIVGMNFHLEQLKSKMKIEKDDVYRVGVYGIGGIGKSTMAMAIYNDISSQFDGSSFLRVDGETSHSGLLELQKKLLRDILKVRSVEIYDHSEGINVIKERLCSKRVLIVLDNVDEIEQLNNLAGKDGWYGAKSIVIITTKDINLLNQHGVDHFYEVKELNHEEAIELFNWEAFKTNIPISEDFKDLSYCVVKYAKGLPLALKILGGFLCDKGIDEWKSELKKLEKIPNIKVQNILRVSYDKLDDVNQGIFLDIASFFRGEDKDFVSRILGSDAIIGIRVLQQRCLITIIENKLDMHDLLQQMGREIVRKECPNEAGERSRLWDPNDVQSVLTRNSGTKTIEGLYFEIPPWGQIQIFRDCFAKMNKLRLLKVHCWLWTFLKFELPMDFELSSFELRYLHFTNYPLESLPTNFHANNLVELHLPSSNIKQLWKENEVLNNLKVMDLSSSKDLIEMPDFSSVPNLEILNLEGCESLESLPRNFHKLEHLQSLCCTGCSKLKSFPQIQGNMSKLREINLSYTAIVEVPSSIGLLDKLEYFNLSACHNLVSLPESICNLRSLKTLMVRRCYNLKGFPDFKKDMENLQVLDLSSAAIEELPTSIAHLKALQVLDLSECENLVNLPGSICDLRSLHTLYVEGYCIQLQEFKVCLTSEDRYDPACHFLTLGISWNNYVCFSSLKPVNQMETGVSNPYHHYHHHHHHRHILPLSSLVELSLRNSMYRECRNFSDEGGFYLSSMEVLSQGDFNPMTGGIIGDIFHQSSLRRISLQLCDLMGEGIPTNNWSLSSLVSLSLRKCNLWEGDILNHICHLSSLEELSLEENHFSSIPANITRLSNLRDLNLSHCKHLRDVPELPSSLRGLNLSQCEQLQDIQELPSSLRGLNLSHCKQLQHIPELPSSLLFLDAHCSYCISSSPSLLSVLHLFRHFKPKLIQEIDIRVGVSQFVSMGMGMSIIIPSSNTIREMIRNPSMGSDEVAIKLPQNWYENNDLLGFALFCVYVPMLSASKSKHVGRLRPECCLTFERNNHAEIIDTLSLDIRCNLCKHDDDDDDDDDDDYDYDDDDGDDDNDDGDDDYDYDDDDGDDDNDDVSTYQMWVIYYPKDAIKGEYRSNQWTQFKALFHGFGTTKVKECGFHLLYALQYQHNQDDGSRQ